MRGLQTESGRAGPAFRRSATPPGLKAAIGLQVKRQDRGRQHLEVDGLAVSRLIGRLIVGQVDGRLALQTQPHVQGLFSQIDLRQRQDGGRLGRLQVLLSDATRQVASEAPPAAVRGIYREASHLPIISFALPIRSIAFAAPRGQPRANR